MVNKPTLSRLATAITIVGAFLCSCGPAAIDFSTATTPPLTDEAWNPVNDPTRIGVKPAKFSDLPREGMLTQDKYPWSDDYWPTRRGGTAYRWQMPHTNHTGTYRDYLYPPMPRDAFTGPATQIAAMIARLSPAEKYDLWKGRYDFPLLQHERRATHAAVDPIAQDVPHWVGLCHGWAPATLLEPEPGPLAEVINPDGLTVPFYTSDINALMTKIYADYQPRAPILGERCGRYTHTIPLDPSGRILIESCRDVNPGALHLILTQLLSGDNAKGFVVDITNGHEVWNQAVTGFKVLSAEVRPHNPNVDPRAKFRAPGTKDLAIVVTEMSYVTEVAAHRAPLKQQYQDYTKTLRLEYMLELDAAGIVIGGEWASDNRPDFLWIPTAKPLETQLISYQDVSALLATSRSH